MLLRLFYIYFVIVAFSVIIGAIRYKKLNNKIAIVFYLLIFTLISETIAMILGYYHIGKNPVYHVYSAIEGFLTTVYFLETIKFKNNKIFFWISAFLWPAIAVLNCLYLQPIKTLNSNVLLLESFTIIAMALYSLYRILMDDSIAHVTWHANFWIWTAFLLLWSSSLFYWAYLHVFVVAGWKYGKIVSLLQILVNILVYSGISVVFFFYPKIRRSESQ